MQMQCSLSLQKANEEQHRLYIEEKNRELELAYGETVFALAKAVEAKDQYTAGHCERVSEMALELGQVLSLNILSLHTLRLAAILHDIGKIGISIDILNKPGRLTPEEFKTIMNHPLIGYNIIKDIAFLKDAAEIIIKHHERVDGSGYPNRLKDEEMSLEAKILCVVDSYDAMTSQRAYRKTPLTHEEACEALTKGKDSQFDAAVVDAFIQMKSGVSVNLPFSTSSEQP